MEAYDYWLDYDPGDDCVDWWGINAFSRKQILGSRPFLEEARRRGKPVIICESAPAFEGGTVSEQSIDGFFAPLFRTIDEYPQIKALVYINIDWSAETGSPFAHWPDSRIQSNTTVSDFYRAALTGDRFLHLHDLALNHPLRDLKV